MEFSIHFFLKPSLTPTKNTLKYAHGSPKGRVQKKLMEISIKALTPPHPMEKKLKMIYAPRNEFCMIWVIFLMPTDHVMAFLCFITDSQLPDMSRQVICQAVEAVLNHFWG